MMLACNWLQQSVGFPGGSKSVGGGQRLNVDYMYTDVNKMVADDDRNC